MGANISSNTEKLDLNVTEDEDMKKLRLKNMRKIKN